MASLISSLLSGPLPSAMLNENDIMAPDPLIDEERRLHEEREKQRLAELPSPSSINASALSPAVTAPFAPANTAPKGTARPAPTSLNTGRFNALENLLNKSEMYTKFLVEQITNDVEGEALLSSDPKQEPAPAPEPKGAKAKGGKVAGGKKRGRADASNSSLSTLEVDEEEQEGDPKNPFEATQKILPLLNADLRDYQIKGVKWLISMWTNGLNGILADQMGLGKTVQTIGFLSHLKSKGVHGPYMVIGPLSTLPNWINEFKRFCPALTPLLYHGSKQEREAMRGKELKMGPGGKVGENFPVICTSYEIVIADSKFLQKYKFKYIVVDEGHRLKNFDCRLIRELKTIPAENKLLLSGTPLQNNLSELWSLLNFLMPEVFSSLSDFEEWFDFSSVVGQEGADVEILAAEQRNKVVSKLHAILKPFVLRRLKCDVEISLPRKAEILLYAHMTEEQKNLNKQLLEGTLREGMLQLAAKEGASGVAAGRLNNVLMQMRKICNHPDLITSAFTTDIEYPPPTEMVRQCGKMQLLERLLDRLHAKNHKVLIFSQMTKMLDLMESYFEQRGHRACRIDGSIPWQERQKSINDFNGTDPSTWLFLLSTRAGGLGINLTAADTVIIYDSDWNPHQDLQAMDRCHRIGQVKPVLVLRLATAHSVEGKMLRRASDKMALERLVIKKGAFKEIASGEGSESGPGGVAGGAASLSAAELLDLLRSDVTLTDVPQSGVLTDEMMDKILDRSYLETKDDSCPLPASGVGYEMMAQQGITGGGLNRGEETLAPAAGEGVGLLRNISGGEGGEDELARLQRDQKKLVDEEAAKKKAKEEEKERQKKVKQAEKDSKKAQAAPVEPMTKRSRRQKE